MVRGASHRGQGVIEFMILFGFLLFFFVAFIAVLQFNTNEKSGDKQRVLFENIARGVRDEVSFAAESSDGYYREFYIPMNVLGRDYDINITD